MSIGNPIVGDLQRVDGDPDMPCALQGAGIMIRQQDNEFLDWFNLAVDQLMKSPEYNKVCQDLTIAHGKYTVLKPLEFAEVCRITLN